MMRRLLILLTLLISNLCFAQLKSVVIDSETKEKIPYVNIWVENEDMGTTSNEEGEFELAVDTPKVILFSAIGFETKKITSDLIKETVELKPLVTELGEVIVVPKKSTQEFIIGEFKKSKINHYFSCGGVNPWIAARFFSYNKKYEKTPFLDKIRVLTNSDVKKSIFNVRLYGINEKGEPEGYIYNQNILGVAKKGKRITEIDLSKYNIAFPKNGFFIAFEWLIIEQNKHEYKYTKEGSKTKFNGVSYEPAFGTILAETDENSWIFMAGNWIRIFQNPNFSEHTKGKYNLLAIELRLTD